MATQVTPTRPPARHAHREPAQMSRWKIRLYKLDVKGSPYAFISPFYLLYAAFGLFPFLYTGWVSLHDWSLLSDAHPFVGLQNYRDVLGDDYFWRALVNTFSILAFATIPQMCLALLLATLLNSRIRGQMFWRLGMLLPNIASVVAVAVIFSQLFGRDFGLINWFLRDVIHVGGIDWAHGRVTSHIAIASMITWRWTGYNALIFLAAMQAIPGELYESARLDGATSMQQLRKITIPMIRPTLIFIIITSVIYGMQIFAEPLIFGGGGVNGMTGGSDRQFQTLTTYLLEHGFSNQYEWGYAGATAYVMLVIIIVVAIVNYLFVRKIRSTQ
jgi:cellobiose transport system permease protein